MGVVTATVYNGRTNLTVLSLKERDGFTGAEANVDFSTVARMVLVILDRAGTEVATVDSDVSASLFDWATAGRLALKLGDVGVPAGRYHARLTAFDGSGGDTELFHEKGPYEVILTFVDTTVIA